MRTYQGQMLIDEEAETLLKLEYMIGKPITLRGLDSVFMFGFVSEHETVTHLNLQKCNLKEIPECIANFQCLIHLNLSDNLINKIENLDSIFTLEELKLGSSYQGHGNYIEEIQGFEYLKELKLLSLEDNYIRKIRNLDNLHKLETLNLANNYIEVIEGISKLRMLKKLYLGGNNITDQSGIKALEYIDFIIF